MSAAIFGLTLGKRTPTSDSELVLVQTSAGELPPLQDRAYAGAVLDVALLELNGEAIRKFAERRGWLNAPLPFAVVEGWPSGTVVEPIADWVAAIHSLHQVVMQWVELGEMIEEYERLGQEVPRHMRYFRQDRDWGPFPPGFIELKDRISARRTEIQHWAQTVLLTLHEAAPMGVTLSAGQWRPSPQTLHQALWVSLGDMASSSPVSLRKCKQCSKWMRIGKGAFNKNREFCSDACKLRHHRLAKATASP